MAFTATGSTYLSSPEDGKFQSSSLTRYSRRPIVLALSGFLALLFFLFISLSGAFLGANSSNGNVAKAGFLGGFCSKMGHGLSDRGGWESFLNSYPSGGSSRLITAQEAFGGNLSFSGYTGEGNNDADFVVEQKTGDGSKLKPDAPKYKILNNADPAWLKSVLSDSQLQPKLSDRRTPSTCGIGQLSNDAANGLLFSANLASSLSSLFSSFAFSTNVVCSKAGNPSNDTCIDLLGIIGGNSKSTGTASSSGSSGGIIGALTGNIYFPLLAIVGLAVAIWVGYKGIVQRKLREAMFGIAWCFASVIFGLFFLLQPSLLAAAPMTASNTLASCVVGAVSGDSCVSTTGAQVKASPGEICKTNAQASANPNTRMSLIVDGLNCNIWKAFVLEPWAQGQFGQPYEDLQTSNKNITTSISKAGLTSDDFCVGLYAADSLNADKGKTLQLNETTGKQCNIGLYQLYLQTQANDDHLKMDWTPTADAPIPQWYQLVAVTIQNNSMWNDWAASPSAGHKLGSALLSGMPVLGAAYLGCAVIVIISIFAVMYYLTAIFMMAFAPLFFLIGVHPGRGREILKGFLGQVLTNIMKYLASALFLIVAIFIYGGILGSATNLGVAYLFVLLMTFALLMYRREVVDLIGKVDLGGKQLANKFDKITDRGGRLAKLAVGSAAGSALAGGSAYSGLKDGIKMDLRRGTGIVAGATRSYEAQGRKNADELKTNRKDLLRSQGTAETDVVTAQNEFGAAQRDVTNHEQATENLVNSSNVLKDEYDEIGRVEARLISLEEAIRRQALGGIRDMDGADKYGQFQDLNASIAINQDALTRYPAGSAQHDTITARLTNDENQRNSLRQELEQSGNFHDLDRVYNDNFEAAWAAQGMDAQLTDRDAKVDAYSEHLREYNSNRDALAATDTSSINERLEAAAARVEESKVNLREVNARLGVLDDAVGGIDPGDTVKMRDVRRADKDALLAAEIEGQQARSEANPLLTDRDYAYREEAPYGPELTDRVAPRESTRAERPTVQPQAVPRQEEEPEQLPLFDTDSLPTIEQATLFDEAEQDARAERDRLRRQSQADEAAERERLRREMEAAERQATARVEQAARATETAAARRVEEAARRAEEEIGKRAQSTLPTSLPTRPNEQPRTPQDQAHVNQAELETLRRAAQGRKVNYTPQTNSALTRAKGNLFNEANNLFDQASRETNPQEMQRLIEIAEAKRAQAEQL